MLQASEQLLYDGIQVGDELNTFSARCRQTDDTQVSVSAPLVFYGILQLALFVNKH